MKRIILSISSCFLALNLFSQTVTLQIAKKNSIGVHVVILQHHKMAIGDYSWQQYGYTLGIDYSRELAKNWTFCTGLEQERHFMFKWQEVDANKLGRFNFIGVPVAFKYDFSIPVYLKFGTVFNFFTYSRIASNGEKNFLLRWQFSAGWEHEFNNGLVLSASPEVRWGGKMHSKTLDEYFRTGYRSYGVNLGIGYKF